MVQGGERIGAEAGREAGRLQLLPGAVLIRTQARGGEQHGDRLWRQDPPDVGTHWPREMEQEAEE